MLRRDLCTPSRRSSRVGTFTLGFSPGLPHRAGSTRLPVIQWTVGSRDRGSLHSGGNPDGSKSRPSSSPSCDPLRPLRFLGQRREYRQAHSGSVHLRRRSFRGIICLVSRIPHVARSRWHGHREPFRESSCWIVGCRHIRRQ